jgi:transcriptional regulator with XRE-family HTH domain
MAANNVSLWLHKSYQQLHNSMNYSDLKKRLDQSPLSQRAIAEKVGMSWPGFFRMVKNQTMSVDVLEKLANALKVDVCELLTDQPAPVNVQDKLVEYQPAKRLEAPAKTETAIVDELKLIRQAIEKMADKQP